MQNTKAIQNPTVTQVDGNKITRRTGQPNIQGRAPQHNDSYTAAHNNIRPHYRNITQAIWVNQPYYNKHISDENEFMNYLITVMGRPLEKMAATQNSTSQSQTGSNNSRNDLK